MLRKVNWCNENMILRPDQKTDRRRHPFQLSRELTSGNDPRIQILLIRIATPWNNLPKNIALVSLGIKLLQEKSTLICS